MNVRRNIVPSALALGVTALVAAAIFAVLLSYAGFSVRPAKAYEVTVVVPSAIRLVEHADVRQAGVRIGSVTSIEPDGRAARLGLRLEERFGPVFANARVLVGAKSLAQENYVDLDPGGPPAKPLPEHGTLPIARAPESTQLDQVIAVLRPERRRDLRRIVKALGRGLGGRGEQLNALVGGAADATVDGYTVVHALAAERLALGRLVNDYTRVADTLGRRGRDLRRLARGSLALARALARSERDIGATLGAAPGFVRAARSSMRRIGRLADAATPVLRDTRVATERLVPAVDRLDDAVGGSRAAIRALGPFTRRATPALRALERFIPPARRFLVPLERNLRELNPMLSYLKPYARDTAVGVTLIGAVAKAQDATSHLFRIMPLLSTTALGGLLTGEEHDALQALLSTGQLLEHTSSRGRNPHPPPGQLKELRTFTGPYPRVTEDPPYSTRRPSRR